MSEPIAVDLAGPVATLTLDRPDRHNALDGAMVAGLREGIDAAADADGVRCVVLDAAGETFCVGADVSALREQSTVETRSFLRAATDAFRHLETCGVPVVSAVRGKALGGGMELAMATDVTVAHRDAEFALPEATLGLLPAGGGTQRLPRIVGRKVASELILTGAFVGADRALSLGLVNRVTEGDPADLASDIAGQIAEAAPQSVAACRELLAEGPELPLDEALDAEQRAVADLLETGDSTEGVEAFLEGRAPEFEDR